MLSFFSKTFGQVYAEIITYSAYLSSKGIEVSKPLVAAMLVFVAVVEEMEETEVLQQVLSCLRGWFQEIWR